MWPEKQKELPTPEAFDPGDILWFQTILFSFERI